MINLLLFVFFVFFLPIAVGCYAAGKWLEAGAFGPMLIPVFIALVLTGLTMWPPLLLTTLPLLVIGPLCARRKWPAWGFAAAASPAVLIGVSFLQIQHAVVLRDMRKRHPMVSIADRLPVTPNKQSQQSTPKPDIQKAVQQLEEAYQGNRNWWLGRRTQGLKQIHSQQLQTFLNGPGFGLDRMMTPIEAVRYTDREYSPKPQRSTPEPTLSAEQEVKASAPGLQPLAEQVRPELESTNRQMQVRFTQPETFGWVKDRDHVAGFIAHRFEEPLREIWGPNETRWEIERVELVSLLLHDPPAVYLSKNLPNMEELRGNPTRPLDAFEKGGLTKLLAGEDVTTEARGDRLYMLGSIRCVKECVQCHTCKEGDLLGAFSYQLRPENWKPAPPEPTAPPREPI